MFDYHLKTFVIVAVMSGSMVVVVNVSSLAVVNVFGSYM